MPRPTQYSSAENVTPTIYPWTTNIYLIGSLRNPNIPHIANQLRVVGYDVFDDWFAPGPEADDYWQKYETARGHSYKEALEGYAARHIFEFDIHHLQQANIGLLVTPAGKSCHLELGWLIGRGVPGYVLFSGEPERWDVMYRFANGIFFNTEELIDNLTTKHPPTQTR